MKRLTALALATALMVSLAACGKAPAKEPETTGPASAVEMLTTVWDSYGDDEKFSVIGGDYSEKNLTEEAPGVYGVEDGDMLDAVLGWPTASADKLEDAASMIFMMNANTFTAGGFHLKADADVNAAAEELKNNILVRQWMCGFPEKLVIFTDGSYIISAWGEGSWVDTYRDKLKAAYPDGSIYYDGAAV